MPLKLEYNNNFPIKLCTDLQKWIFDQNIESLYGIRIIFTLSFIIISVILVLPSFIIKGRNLSNYSHSCHNYPPLCHQSRIFCFPKNFTTPDLHNKTIVSSSFSPNSIWHHFHATSFIFNCFQSRLTYQWLSFSFYFLLFQQKNIILWKHKKDFC
jgi:hypothetical protein